MKFRSKDVDLRLPAALLLSVASLALLSSCISPTEASLSPTPDPHDKGNVSLDCSNLTNTQKTFSGLVNEDYLWIDHEPFFIGNGTGIKVIYQNYVDSTNNNHIVAAKSQLYESPGLGVEYSESVGNTVYADNIVTYTRQVNVSRPASLLIYNVDRYTKTLSISLSSEQALSNTINTTIACEKQ